MPVRLGTYDSNDASVDAITIDDASTAQLIQRLRASMNIPDSATTARAAVLSAVTTHVGAEWSARGWSWIRESLHAVSPLYEPELHTYLSEVW